MEQEKNITRQKVRERMNRKLAELEVDKSEDYYDKVAKALQDAGFVLVLDSETIAKRYYIVAKKED